MIELTRVSGVCTVQDGGRPGRMHEGIPPGGAMCPELLARANAFAKNPHVAAALEAFGDVELLARCGVVVATDGGVTRTLAAGERLAASRPRGQRVHYVALRGGLDVPTVLGGKGTLLVAGLGGHEGRALRTGDEIAVGAAPAEESVAPTPYGDGPIAVVAGPDADLFPPDALALLTSATFTVSPASDRSGTRLTGPPLPVRDARSRGSAPMVRGALEVTPDGTVIVLGPDHPTTGGYPVVACVRSAELGRLMRAPLGENVRFFAF